MDFDYGGYDDMIARRVAFQVQASTGHLNGIQLCHSSQLVNINSLTSKALSGLFFMEMSGMQAFYLLPLRSR